MFYSSKSCDECIRKDKIIKEFESKIEGLKQDNFIAVHQRDLDSKDAYHRRTMDTRDNEYLKSINRSLEDRVDKLVKTNNELTDRIFKVIDSKISSIKGNLIVGEPRD
jgi:hypothetical protein